MSEGRGPTIWQDGDKVRFTLGKLPAAVRADTADSREQPPECPTCGKRQWPVIHSCRGIPAARPAEPTGELQERVAEWLFDKFFDDVAELPEGWLEDKADELLSGPLAPLLAKLRAVEELAEAWEAARDHHVAPIVEAARLRRALAGES